MDFRHVIPPLLRKPGAFIHYRHREALYPSAVFRAAYDRLVADHGERPGVIEYLHVLKLAAEETRGEGRSRCCKSNWRWPGKWRALQVREQLVPAVRQSHRAGGLTPSLKAYDTLLEGEVAHVG